MYSRPIPKRHAYYREEEDDDEEEEDEELNEYPEQNDDEEDDAPQGYSRKFGSCEGLERFPKRQKQSKPISGYEFAGPSDSKLAQHWSDHEAFVLLEVWGDRFLQLGRRSLRNEDWNEVAEKVSEELRVEKSETQCRSMMVNLKGRYKKEKTKLEKSGLGSSKWVFFNKLDMLLGPSSRSDSGLACGVDSGEFVFMNTRVYLDKSNGFDEMMDSPGDSEMGDEDEEEDDAVEDRRRKVVDSGSYRLLADSVQRFGKIYEKIENSKREHMRELEKMRTDFQRELELQKKQIVERAQAEIAKIREENDDGEEDDDDHDDSEPEEMDNDSATNLSE
ncbi:PREDICTED: trihelix transcription factor ASIL2 isoform X2 [Tarenaya hassleriana]|nr:PREDICTED: trihelix transcription factor ASIL2 isoform X2 [Tarenaya hassleriana]XP_010527187.1 PREDICTED: trihelix transcription factor ASIL2 isoform X2 [Tarenaya hassleriana]